MEEHQENMAEIGNEEVQNQRAEPENGSDAAAEADKQQDPASRLAEAEKQIEYYKDLLLRRVAEFDNFKKRAESELSSIVKYGKTDVLQSLLPVIDDFERSLKLSKDTRESEAFAKGVELIYQKLLKFLDTQGIKQIDSLGKEFDVHYHDALLQIPRNDVPPHMVIEVVEKGYMLDDRVLRHAKVIVSTTPPESGGADSGSTTPPSQPKQEN
jgi:molecular chaperone GrpE